MTSNLSYDDQQEGGEKKKDEDNSSPIDSALHVWMSLDYRCVLSCMWMDGMVGTSGTNIVSDGKWNNHKWDEKRKFKV